MGLYIECDIECEVVCDDCGRYENKDNISPTKFKKEMRGKGWRIGELTFCPECANAIKGQRGVGY